MQKIIPCLWFDKEAEEAAKFYVSLFKNSKILQISHYGDAGSKMARMPNGSVMTVAFKLNGMEFTGLNGGPIFKLNPSVSFFVNCNEKELDVLWKKLSKGGKILMELGEYPFSKKYGWLEDKYGLSWQLSIDKKQKITPSLLFVKSKKAKDAIKFYTSLFKNSKINMTVPYEKREGEPKGTIKYASFTLNEEDFVAMDSSMDHKFSFNEAISFMIRCKDQKELDYFWDNLSKGGEKGPCGWLKDKYGLSWQVVPSELDKWMKDKKKAERIMEKLLTMKKLDIKTLDQA